MKSSELEVANKLYRSKKYKKALTVYHNLSVKSPVSKWAQINAVFACIKLGDLTIASARLERIKDAGCLSQEIIKLAEKLIELHALRKAREKKESGESTNGKLQNKCKEPETNPMLSIVIPVFNCEDFIENTVNSILSDAKITLEIILVDDGSTDYSAIVCEKLAGIYNNVYLIKQNNAGAGIARNIALSSCTGEFVYFLDADDYVVASAMSDAVLYAKEHRYDLLFFKYQLLYHESKKIMPMFQTDQNIWNKLLICNSQTEKKSEAFRLIGYPWNRIISKELIETHNIYFSPTIVHNDIPYHWHSIAASNNIGIFDQNICMHRKFATKEQLSGITDVRRLSIFESLSLIRYILEKYSFEFDIFSVWTPFVAALLKWAYNKVPTCLHFEFRNKCRSVFLGINHSVLKDASKQLEIPLGELMIGNFGYKLPDGGREEGGMRLRSWRPIDYKSKVVTIVTVMKDIIKPCQDRPQGDRSNHWNSMLKSIMDQDYGRENIEHVIVDGGSTDGSVEIIKQLDKDGHIDYWVSEKDYGIYNALNKGADYANGKYILFLNSDDYLHPSAISLLVDAIESNGVDYSFADSPRIHADGHEVGKHIGDINKIYFGVPCCHQTLLCKTSCFEKVRFDEQFKVTMWPFSLDLHMMGYRYAYVNRDLAFFRLGGLSSDEAHKQIYIEELRKIKMEYLVKRLNLTYDEYEILNHIVKGWKIPNPEISLESIFHKLSSPKDSFQEDFNFKLFALLPPKYKTSYLSIIGSCNYGGLRMAG